MKKFIAVVLTMSLMLCLAACTPDSPEAESVPQQSRPVVQLANPYLTLDTAEEMMDAAGFQVLLPTSLPDWVTETIYRTIPGELIEVIYKNETNEIRVRIAGGTKDISGVYDTDHQDRKETEVNGNSVDLKGIAGEDFLVFVSTWVTQEGRTYSVTSTEGVPESLLLPLLAEIR